MYSDINHCENMTMFFLKIKILFKFDESLSNNITNKLPLKSRQTRLKSIHLSAKKLLKKT